MHAESRLTVDAIDRVSGWIRALPLPVEETVTLDMEAFPAAAEIPFISEGGDVVVV